MKFIEFNPIYKKRVWGGRRLEASLGRALPADDHYGESWDIVDRDDDQSIVANGQWKGMTIKELLKNHGHYIMGPTWNLSNSFPVLVKWLDCREDLSLQVHPPQSIAKKLGGQSKTENWYVAEADQDSKICIGLKNGIKRTELETALMSGNVSELLTWVKSKSNDAIFIPSGTFHAIGGGNLILEIQENSDTTYRVSDWGRLDSDGNPRELHIQEALESANFDSSYTPQSLKTSSDHLVLADCDRFRILKKTLNSKPLVFEKNQEPKIISVVSGELYVYDSEGVSKLLKGTNFLLPYGETFSLESPSECTILITDRFLS